MAILWLSESFCHTERECMKADKYLGTLDVMARLDRGDGIGIQ